MKLISICPSNTELIAYLGLTKQLIAIDDFSDWPEDISHLPRLGPDLSIDMDKVEELKPDLVLASLSVPGMERNIEELEKRDIPHIILNPNTLEDIANDLLKVGKATNSEKQAEVIVEKYISIIETYRTLSKKIPEDKRPLLYWEWWPKPVFTPGKLNWLTIISELAGGRNLFADVELASVQTNWEDVENRNPDHICMAWVGVKQDRMNPSLIKKRPGWNEVAAVKNERIHLLEESLYCRPSPRLLVGLKKLASLIHPTFFPVDDEKDPLLEITHLNEKANQN